MGFLPAINHFDETLGILSDPEEKLIVDWFATALSCLSYPILGFLLAINHFDKTLGIRSDPEVKLTADCFARTLSCLSYRSCAVLPNLFSRSNINQFIIVFYVYMIIIYVHHDYL